MIAIISHTLNDKGQVAKHTVHPFFFFFFFSFIDMAAALARIFGSGKKGEPPSPQQAIQKLRETEEMLSKKSEFLEKRIEKELNAAKKHGMKNKRGE